MVGINQESSLTVTKSSSSLSPREIVFTLFRRRWVILAISLPIILVGGSSLFRQTGSYMASAKVVVELTKVDLPQWNVNARNIDFDRELSTLFTIAMSIPVAENAAASLRDSLPIIRKLAPNLVDIEEENNFADFLQGGLDVSVIGESNVLEFRFTSVDPRISLMAVGALQNAFLQFQIHGRKNRKAVEFYQEQRNSVRSQIDSLLASRGRILTDNDYISLVDDLKYESGLLAELRGNLEKARVDRATLEAQYDQLAPYLEGDPREFPMGPDESRIHSLIYWRNLVSKHDDEMSSILTVYNWESDVAQRQRELIQDTLDKLVSEERSYVRSIKVAADAIRGKEAALKSQIEQLLEKSRTAPDVYQKVTLIDAEITSLRTLFDDIQGKLGEVRLNEFADERVSNVQRLTAPELSSAFSGGKTVVYFAMIVVFAIALGIVVAFLLDSMDHRIYDPRDVEDNLKLPVFASVTKGD